MLDERVERYNATNNKAVPDAWESYKKAKEIFVI